MSARQRIGRRSEVPCPERAPLGHPRSQLALLTSLLRPRKIRVRQPLARVRLLGGSKRDGGGWTAGISPHRPGSESGGASTLSNSLQQAPVHAAEVAGHPLPDALRGLDLSRGRGAAERAPRMASDVGTAECARFHDFVPFPAASGRSEPRSGGGRNGPPDAGWARPRAPAGSGGRRRNRLSADSSGPRA